MRTAEEIIASLGLEPHPEGGWFKRLYPSTDKTSSISTIYYLLQENDFSAFHRLDGMTEIWYHHDGGPLFVHVIDKEGNLTTHRIGDKEYQVVVEPGQWFAAEPVEGSKFCLVGCAVSPEFVYSGFELAERESLVSLYPQHSELIKRLTR